MLSANQTGTVPLPDKLELLTAVTKGLTNHDIARQFGIAHVSVKKQLKTIFSKLGAANRAEAVAIAIGKQLVKM